MTALRVRAFDGLVPKLSPTLLGDNFAQRAENVKLYSGELRYWRGPTRVHDSPGTGYQSLYRLYNSAGASVFLLWSTNVDVAAGPVADTTDSRIYYTGSGTPKKTNYALATSGAEPYPTSYLEMGLPKPSAAPAATVTVAGTGTAETRAYVFTWVSTFGALKEESQPSDPATVTVQPVGATVRINGFPAAPAGAYNITHRRIYRTVVGSASVSYEFVAEIAIGTTLYDDSLTAAQLGEVLATEGWTPPPATLAGLVALPSGTLAGFVGNTVYFSEPYFPHAWPVAYAITLPVANIIGLGVLGSSLAVMTDTIPIFIHGGIPGEMYTEQVQLNEPCIAKATITGDADSVIYASPNGLVGLASNGRGLLTANLFTTDEWSSLIPATMKAVVYQGRYIGLFPDEVPSRAMILSRNDPPALSFIQMPADAMHVDARNGLLFYVDAITGDVYQLDADNNQPVSFEWRSKRWQLEAATTFSCLRLDADYSQLTDAAAYNAQAAAIAAYNASVFAGNLAGALGASAVNTFDVNGSLMQNQPELASSRTAQVVIYGDGEVVANVTLDSLDPIRLPPFKARELELAIFGNVYVRSLHIASTMEELRGT
jgi:hypothetical protein